MVQKDQDKSKVKDKNKDKGKEKNKAKDKSKEKEKKKRKKKDKDKDKENLKYTIEAILTLIQSFIIKINLQIYMMKQRTYHKLKKKLQIFPKDKNIEAYNRIETQMQEKILTK